MYNYKEKTVHYLCSHLTPLAGRVVSNFSITAENVVVVNNRPVPAQNDFILSAHNEDGSLPVEVRLPVDVMNIDAVQVADTPFCVDHINVSRKADDSEVEHIRFDLIDGKKNSVAWFTGTIRKNHFNSLGAITPNLIVKTYSVSAALKPAKTSTEADLPEINLNTLANTAESLISPYTYDDMSDGFKGHKEACEHYFDDLHKVSVRPLPGLGAVQLVYQVDASSATQAGEFNDDIANRIAHRIKNKMGINLEVGSLGLSY